MKIIKQFLSFNISNKKIEGFYIENIIFYFSLFLIFILILFLSLRRITDADIGFHLKGGEWMLVNKSFHRYDEFTYTVNKNEYIAMYWLFQIIIYLIYKISDYRGIVIFKTIIVLLIYFIILLRLLRYKIHPVVILSILLLSIFPFELRFSVRPEIFTYLFLALTLFILEEYYYRKENYLFLLPFINLLWVNLHGLFILSWFVLITYLISIFIHNKKMDKTFLKYTIFSILICLLNPYFFKGILFPFYLFTRLQGGSIFKSAVTELISPWAIIRREVSPFLQRQQIYIYYFLSVSGFLVTFIKILKRKLHEILLFVIFFILSAMAMRNIPLFLIVSIPFIGNFINDIRIRIPVKLLKTDFKICNLIFFTVIPIITIIFILKVYTNDYYFSKRTYMHFGIGIEENIHPVKATEFLCKNNLDGRILNDLNSGSWLVWKGPQKVFIDGRLEVMREEFFKKYLISFEYPGGLKKLIDEYKPDIVFFDYDASLLWYLQLKNIKDFRIIYCDINTAIYLRKGYREELKEININDVICNMGFDTTITEKEEWDILKIKRKNKIIRYFESLYKKQVYPYELVNLGLFAFHSDNIKSAIILHLEFLKRTNAVYYETYFNLAEMYLILGKYEKSLYCYKKFLEYNPRNKIAKERIKELKKIPSW